MSQKEKRSQYVLGRRSESARGWLNADIPLNTLLQRMGAD
jgi:hypothetical protein